MGKIIRNGICYSDSTNYDVIAPKYSSEESYNIGAYVYYNNNLYKCISPTSTGEDFDVSKWDKTVVSHTLEDLSVCNSEEINIEEYICGGIIFNEAKEIAFNVPVGKNLKDVSRVSVMSLKGGFRTVNGQCLNNSNSDYEWVGKTNITVSGKLIKANNSIKVKVQTNSSFTNLPSNNTPLGIEASIILKFEK